MGGSGERGQERGARREGREREPRRDGASLRLLYALNSEDRGLKVRFSLAMIVFETFELILRQMLSSQGKNAPSNPYPHYLVRLATSRLGRGWGGRGRSFFSGSESPTKFIK